MIVVESRFEECESSACCQGRIDIGNFFVVDMPPSWTRHQKRPADERMHGDFIHPVEAGDYLLRFIIKNKLAPLPSEVSKVEK